MPFDPQKATTVCRFFEGILRHPKERYRAFTLLDWQKQYLRHVFGLVDEEGLRRIRRCYLEVAKKNGKALALDTPIPTPCGWTTMGELQPGDTIFGEAGQHASVIAATEPMHGHECYAVELWNGERIVADADHLWLTNSRSSGLGLRTTEQIADSVWIDTPGCEGPNHSLSLSGPITARQILSVTAVPSVPVRCIQVDSPTGLFLAGRSMVPTHNSEFAAGVALFMLAADGEPAAEVYLAATTKEQAGIVFRTAAAMVEASPVLRSELKVIRSTKRIVKRGDFNSFLAAISADGGAQDGINPHAVIIDELHRWKTGKSHELMNVLVKGTVARKQPLVLEITTAGSTEDESPLAWLEHARVRSIEAGDFSDPTFYGKIYAADPKDDWTSPETWLKANPSLVSNGGFLRLESIEAECRAAINQPSLQAAFKRYHLGVWLSTETEWMPRETWKACSTERRPLVERSCYLGLDLSERVDLTSLVLLFPSAEEDGSISYDVLPFFWMAEDRIQERELADRVPYGPWVEQGLLETSSGDVIDLRDIKKKIKWASEVFDVKEIAFDPHHALQLSIELTEEYGLKCVPVPQRFTHVSEPTKKLMELALQKKLRHEGNKILSWNMNCLRVRSDGNDNVRPVKPDRFRSGKRIDGAVALILALSRAMFHKGSVYETRGILSASV